MIGSDRQVPFRPTAANLFRKVEDRKMLSQNRVGSIALDRFRASVPTHDCSLGVEHQKSVGLEALEQVGRILRLSNLRLSGWAIHAHLRSPLLDLWPPLKSSPTTFPSVLMLIGLVR